MPSRFFVTTPIYYVNGAPSVGHAYTLIAADVLARYHRLLGEEVFFLTGTDENSQKNVEAAEKAGKGDQIPAYLDEMAALWKKTCTDLQITYTRFIRTTEADHAKAVEKFWKAVEAKGDIFRGTYEGLYCKGCEAFYTQTDLLEGLCPIHKTPPEQIQEQNYFFRLTAYREALLKYIETHPDFIQPISRRNEVVSYIEHFMTDISISRSTMKWGIPVPGDETQRIYVWFDALINYLTGVGYASDEKLFESWWPANLHLVGKDIIKFHCALWPAMLLSAGLPLPEQVFAHGYFTVDGEKMGKSLGNVIDPLEITNAWGNDVLRFYLLREIRFGEDGDFSRARLSLRYESELANELGNFAQRVLAMTDKYLGGLVPLVAEDALGAARAWSAYHAALSSCHFHEALDIIWSLLRSGNQFVEERAPWKLAKEEKTVELQETLYVLLETLRHIAWMLRPIMPDASARILERLGQNILTCEAAGLSAQQSWGMLQPGSRVTTGEPLFPRKEIS